MGGAQPCRRSPTRTHPCRSPVAIGAPLVTTSPVWAGCLVASVARSGGGDLSCGPGTRGSSRWSASGRSDSRRTQPVRGPRAPMPRRRGGQLVRSGPVRSVSELFRQWRLPKRPTVTVPDAVATVGGRTAPFHILRLPSSPAEPSDVGREERLAVGASDDAALELVSTGFRSSPTKHRRVRHAGGPVFEEGELNRGVEGANDANTAPIEELDDEPRRRSGPGRSMWLRHRWRANGGTDGSLQAL